jgi:hypothetical protein
MSLTYEVVTSSHKASTRPSAATSSTDNEHCWEQTATSGKEKHNFITKQKKQSMNWNMHSIMNLVTLKSSFSEQCKGGDVPPRIQGSPGFHTVGGGIYPRHEFDMGDIPPINLIFWEFFSSGFWNFKCNFKAELSILRCLKLIRGLFPFIYTNFFSSWGNLHHLGCNFPAFQAIIWQFSSDTKLPLRSRTSCRSSSSTKRQKWYGTPASRIRTNEIKARQNIVNET